MSGLRLQRLVLVLVLLLLGAGVGAQIAAAPQPELEATPGSASDRASTQQAFPGGVTIPYQGRLEGETGIPAADGAYDFSFALFEGNSGGEALWSEVQEDVPVRDGTFLTDLGRVTGIAEGVMAGGARWLAVGVRGPGESEFVPLSPRLRVDASGPSSLSAPSSDMACPHDHAGEIWISSGSEPVLDLRNSGAGLALRVSSENGTSLSVVGTGRIMSSADSIVFLSPHEMIARELNPNNVSLTPLANGGVHIVNPSGTNVTRYVSLPVSTFGTLYGSQFFVRSLEVCYKAPSADTYIDVTAVIKNNGAEADTFYILNDLNRSSDTHDCYEIIADTPRKAVDNSTWVQFNVRFADAWSELYIYTVKLTLTQDPITW